MAAHVVEQRVGVEPAAANVDPVSLPRERADAVRRQLRRLLVDESAQSFVERVGAIPNTSVNAFGATGRNDVSLDRACRAATSLNGTSTPIASSARRPQRRDDLGQRRLHRTRAP